MLEERRKEPSLGRTLGYIARVLNFVLDRVIKMSAQMDDLVQAVHEAVAGEASAIALLNHLAEAIDGLGSNPDPAAAAALAAEVRASTASLAAAVVADARDPLP